MIFLGRIESPLVVERQWLAMEKIQKKWKNVKKSAEYFPGHPGFSAKQPCFLAKNAP
jgi:hypothetical protein